jgi:hypothetical protein
MQQEIGRFRAKGDDGAIYTVIEYQNFTETGILSGFLSPSPGSRELKLTNGAHVNFLDDNTFQISNTEQIIRRID